ncbi:methyltransferase [Anaerovorax odorimutans]|uniref:methyltransferase n=1 Tax=Anaerovorax odorimutans TaxID=109327 RepID=UPI00040FDE71|nr:methyltransferase [Anaerovorax odorimutans]
MKKDSNKMPPQSAKRILGVTNQLVEAQLVYIAIRLEVFSHLSNAKTSIQFAEETGYDKRNSELLLNALTSADYLIKKDDKYENASDVELYLNKNSEYYLGEYMLFWYKIKDLYNVESFVRLGPTYSSFNDSLGSDSYDFRKMAEVAVNQFYSGRVQTFLSAIKENTDFNKSTIKALDLGGGCGVLGIELAKNFPSVKAIIYDQKEILTVADDVIAQNNILNQVKTHAGNFITDDIGSGYDLIIASGVLDFCGDVEKMCRKIYNAMNSGGYFYVDTHQINDDYTAPSQCIIGWLASHMDGLDILKSDNIITNAIKHAGFLELINSENLINPYYLFKKK